VAATRAARAAAAVVAAVFVGAVRGAALVIPTDSVTLASTVRVATLACLVTIAEAVAAIRQRYAVAVFPLAIVTLADFVQVQSVAITQKVRNIQQVSPGQAISGGVGTQVVRLVIQAR